MAQPQAQNLSIIAPAEFLESCIGQRITAITIQNIEITGILRGYDSFSNLLMDDVVELTFTPEGTKIHKVDKIFLVSMRIAMISKDEAPPYELVK